jgi:hypothetical protein
MKLPRLPLALALLPLALPAAAGAQQFAGVVTIRTAHLTSDLVAEQIGEDADERAREKIYAMTLAQVEQLGGPADANVMQFKAGRMRSAPFEYPGMDSAYMLIDVGTAMMRIVSPSKRSYYEMSLRGTPTPSGAAEEAAQRKIEPLGRTQVIGGLQCTGYRVTEGDVVSHVWTTSDPAFRELVMSWLKMANEEDEAVQQTRALLARYGAPVMTQEFDEDGGYRIEVWSLERRSLPDALFAVPAGFTKLATPGR